MTQLPDISTDIVDLILQHLYISLIYTHDRSFFAVMKASPGCQRAAESLFYDADTSRWDAAERQWRMLDLEDAECDMEVLEKYAEVRRHYYENGMLSWQANWTPEAGISGEVK